MNERKLSNFCLLLLVFSMLLRLICATGADARMAESVPAAQTEPDEPAAPAAQQLRVWPVRVIRDGNASEAEPWEQTPGTADRQTDDAERAPALTFSPEEADAITIAGACTYSVDKQALLTRPSALDFSGEGPKVLIVHTHSSEAYTQEAGWEYDESDPLRTENADRSIIRVGDEIASVLERTALRRCTTRRSTTIRPTMALTRGWRRPSSATSRNIRPSGWCSTYTATRRRMQTASRSASRRRSMGSAARRSCWSSARTKAG